jgi:Flp pilus assembly protein TadG
VFTFVLGRLQSFRGEERGTIAIMFALCSFVLIMGLGMAIDIARAMHTKSRIASAADASALAAAKRMHDASVSTTDIVALAKSFFDANMGEGGLNFGSISAFDVAVDRVKSTVSVSVTADVPTTFARIGGFENISLPSTAVAAYNPTDIEVSLSLDLTGSMCNPCTKIEDLKSAATDLVDILLPTTKINSNRVRVALAPFAAGVNAGTFAKAATDNRSTDGCVFERDGSERATDTAPGSGAYLKIAGDAGVSSNRNNCPSGAAIVPLTDSADQLRTAISKMKTGGSTAGHLGTAWAWYMLSPAWNAIWPTTSATAPYKDGKTLKAVILMTDGVYNTFGGACDRGCSNVSDQADKSQELARNLCRNMSERGIVVYSVGFMLDDARAESVLRDCAGGRFYRAENGTSLRQAFRDIAADLMALRLAQ